MSASPEPAGAEPVREDPVKSREASEDEGRGRSSSRSRSRQVSTRGCSHAGQDLLSWSA